MSKYMPKFDKEDRDLLILDNLFAVDDCVEYASRHNLNVLFTETTSTSSVEAMMAFKKNGYEIEMYEKENRAPDGIKLNPIIHVLFTRKGNVPEVKENRMTVKEYNEEFLPKYERASSFIQLLDSAITHTNEDKVDRDELYYHLRLRNWSEETKETILKALACYREYEGIRRLE